MYVVKSNEQTCCTCDHWTGTRVREEDGFVYSLKNLEGICGGIKHMLDGTEFRRALTFPNTTCNSWQRWFQLDSRNDTLAANPMPGRMEPLQESA